MTTSHEHTVGNGDGGFSGQRRLRKLGELFDLRDLGVVVTGGGSRLGMRMGTAPAEAGAHVTLLDNVVERPEQTRSALADRDLRVDAEVADITDLEHIDEVFGRLEHSAHGLHAVFANAGISAGVGPRLKSERITDLDRQRWQQVLDVNLTGQ